MDVWTPSTVRAQGPIPRVTIERHALEFTDTVAKRAFRALLTRRAPNGECHPHVGDALESERVGLARPNSRRIFLRCTSRTGAA